MSSLKAELEAARDKAEKEAARAQEVEVIRAIARLGCLKGRTAREAFSFVVLADRQSVFWT